ncbi:hypothetical protein BDQ17DRAFT_1376406 [Cyathus striatus]|nr:hypothetical protein BDQ17DRAFT_1376406 [Cyathus striatus]
MTARNASLVSIPVELLQEIVQLNLDSCPELRLVCKRLNDIAVPYMFSHATIKYSGNEKDLEILEATATGVHPSVLHATSLTIHDLHPPLKYMGGCGGKITPVRRKGNEDAALAHSETLKNWLTLAISQFKLVKTVTWRINNSTPAWSSECITAFIAQLTNLTTLVINAKLSGRRSIQLHSFPPVQNFTLQAGYGISVSDNGTIQGMPEFIAKSSSKLLRLEINRSDRDPLLVRDTTLLHSITRDASPLHITSLTLVGIPIELSSNLVPHLRSLKSLCLKYGSEPLAKRRLLRNYNDQEIVQSYETRLFARNTWNILNAKKIHLQEISLDKPTESFVQYLTSYSGLESLTITSATITTPECSDSIAQDFYLGALCAHENSLTSLVISPWLKGKWCIGEHNMDSISKLINLRNLSIPIVPNSNGTSNSRESESEDRVAEELYNQLHPVYTLLDIASLLPKLCVLTIHDTGLATNYTVEHQSGITCPAIHPTSRFDITSFGPLDPSRYRFTLVLDPLIIKIECRSFLVVYDWYFRIISNHLLKSTVY